MLFDFLSLAVANIWNRRKRSLLTVIGIFIGVAAIVALFSLAQGMQEAIVAQFENLGKDSVTVLASAGFASTPFASEVSANPLTTRDLEVVEKTRGIEIAAGVLVKPALVEFSDESKTLVVTGYPLDEKRKLFEELGGYEIADGRKLRPSDGRKAVVGSYIADGVYKRVLRTGESLELQGKRYEVVGVFKSTGDRFDDSAVYVPLESMRRDFERGGLVSMMFARVSPGFVPAEVAEKVRDRLAESRGEKEGQETFSVSTSEQLLATFSQIIALVQAVVIGLASISLVVGAIGIMNTMYTSVVERTKEIGIMKAVGARNADVLTLFVIESGMLGAVGGGLGVLEGYAVSKAVESVAERALGSSLLQAYFPIELALGALFFSFVLGTLSGALPAMQAAKLSPVEALRYE